MSVIYKEYIQTGCYMKKCQQCCVCYVDSCADLSTCYMHTLDGYKCVLNNYVWRDCWNPHWLCALSVYTQTSFKSSVWHHKLLCSASCQSCLLWVSSAIMSLLLVDHMPDRCHQLRWGTDVSKGGGTQFSTKIA